MASPTTTDDLVKQNNDKVADNEHENQSDATSSSDDATSQEKKDEAKAEEYDGDPDELCSQLENMELTEEETEELLKEALEINKKLKAELKRQEREKSAKSAKRQSRSTPSNTVERPGSGRYGVLPPITSKGNAQRHAERDKIYGAKSSPTKNGQTSHSTTKYRDGASVSAGYGNKRQSSKSSRVTQSADSKQTRSKSKPEWNDRFSFS